MSFYKLNEDFQSLKKGDVLLINGISHFHVVKIATPTTKTVHTNIYGCHIDEPVKALLTMCTPLPVIELKKLRHHLTWRIWVNDASSLIQNKGVSGFSFDILNEKKSKDKKPFPLPPLMCYECLREGNPYMTHKPKTEKVGICKCCNSEKPLIWSIYGHPIDLTKKGFGFTILPTGDNYRMNIRSYSQSYDLSIYSDYNGEI